MNTDSISDPQTYAIIGAAMEVHSTLGYGFLEAVYKEALKLEFDRREIPAIFEVEVPVIYKSTVLSTTYRADIIIYDSIIIELKALKALSSIEEAQILNYLKATNMKKGLLLNFGRESLEFKRFVI